MRWKKLSTLIDEFQSATRMSTTVNQMRLTSAISPAAARWCTIRRGMAKAGHSRLRKSHPDERRSMKQISIFVIAAATAVSVSGAMILSARGADDESSRVFGGKIPPGYRDWRLISVAHEEGNLNDLRAILGNGIAIKAYREGQLPFPDGTIIARLAWSYVSSEENNKVFGRPQSFVAGPPTNVQFMVKDSKKYMSTGGWGFAQFNDGKLADLAVQDCFSCHVPVKTRDFVFARYAP
jgi:hypothetical protein